MKRFIILFALAISGADLSAQDFECPFVQTRLMVISGKTVVSEGTMTYTAPDQLAMVYSKPEGEYLVIDGNTVRMDLAGQIATIDAKKNATAGALSRTLLDCIAGNWEKAAKDNDADSSVSEKGGVKTVILTARKASPRGGYSKIELYYRLKDNFLTKMVLEENGGGIRTTYELK